MHKIGVDSGREPACGTSNHGGCLNLTLPDCLSGDAGRDAPLVGGLVLAVEPEP